MKQDRFGLAEEPEESEQEEDAIEALLDTEALSLLNEIRQLDPDNAEALPQGYRRTPADIARLKDQLRELKEKNECHNYLQETIDRVQRGIRYPHRNDGAVLRNDEGLLPREPGGYYNEYVVPTAGIYGPGAQRLITGANGELYYSPDHYGAFIRIK
jgi:guanyl-specific ribonuclease Sa